MKAIIKTLIWKIKYAFEIRRLLNLSLYRGWDMAGSWIECFGDEMNTCTPRQAAEEELEE